MTNANMKLVVVEVPFPDKLKIYNQKLDAGEFITRRIVALDNLFEEFAGMCKTILDLFAYSKNTLPPDYSAKVCEIGLLRPICRDILKATYLGLRYRCQARALRTGLHHCLETATRQILNGNMDTEDNYTIVCDVNVLPSWPY